MGSILTPRTQSAKWIDPGARDGDGDVNRSDRASVDPRAPRRDVDLGAVDDVQEVGRGIVARQLEPDLRDLGPTPEVEQQRLRGVLVGSGAVALPPHAEHRVTTGADP